MFCVEHVTNLRCNFRDIYTSIHRHILTYVEHTIKEGLKKYRHPLVAIKIYRTSPVFNVFEQANRKNKMKTRRKNPMKTASGYKFPLRLLIISWQAMNEAISANYRRTLISQAVMRS